MISKKDLYNELVKRALDNQKLEVVHENGNLVAQKTQEVVNKIFDVYCDEISGCTSEELHDLRRFIGVLPTNDKEISLIRIGHVKYNTVFGILVDSAKDYYKEKMQKTGKPISLDTKLDTIPISTRTYNYITESINYEKELEMKETENVGTGKWFMGLDMDSRRKKYGKVITLNDLVDKDLTKIKHPRGCYLGKAIVNELEQVLIATGHREPICDFKFEDDESVIDRGVNSNIIELKKLRNRYIELQAKKAKLLELEKYLMDEISKAEDQLCSVLMESDTYAKR